MISLFMVINALAAGSVLTPSDDKVLEPLNRYGGYVLTISATADDTAATFPTCLFHTSATDDTNKDIYAKMQGKWLTSAMTKPGTIAPTTNYDIYILEGATATGEYILNSAALAIGGTTTNVYSGAFGYIINATAYTKAEVAAGTAPGNDVIPQSTYGAVAFDIGADGTIDAIEAADNATGYSTAALAVAGIAAAASDHCRIGWVTATKSDGAFTFGTTALNAANSTVAYTSVIPAVDVMGGRLTNRSATANEIVFPANTAGDNAYYFIHNGLMVAVINNSINSATFTLELKLN